MHEDFQLQMCLSNVIEEADRYISVLYFRSSVLNA